MSDTCVGYEDEDEYKYTVHVGCHVFDGLYPGPALPPPPLPPGVTPPPGWPPPPTYAYFVETHTDADCAVFDSLYPEPDYTIEVLVSDTCPETSVCCGCRCCVCSGYWTQYELTISGVTGPSQSCLDLNGTWLLSNGTGCLWQFGEIPPGV
jgi:hypothetical protein